jgi:hypothetical protein
MSLETLALGAISGLRPATSQAAVVALVKSPDPRRTLLFFILAGFTTSTAIGLVLVLALHGARVSLGGSTFTAVADLVLGAAAIGLAFAYRAGRVSAPRRRTRGAPADGGSGRLARTLRNPSVTTAAVAGIATHLPGLIYLVALNAIAADDPKAASAAVAVVVYNALWFALPLAALALAILRPGRALEYLERATLVGRRHEQGIVFATLALLGGYLAVKGAIRLF